MLGPYQDLNPSAGARALGWITGPRGIFAVVLTLLTGFGVAAFGIAPMAPDAAALPKHLVSVALPLPQLPERAEALDAQALTLYRSTTSRSSDTAETLLARLGIADVEAAAFLRDDAQARRLLDGRAGKLLQARAAADGTLEELTARYAADAASLAGTHFTRLHVARGAGGAWTSRVETAPLVAEQRLGSGVIRSSLFAATDDARLPDGIASQLAEIFSADIDFHRELRRGDSFSVVYEVLTADGEPAGWLPSSGAGRVLSAEFVNEGQAYSAMWFQDASGRGNYYAFDGTSRRRSFLASPMAFSRVTSGFSMRFHPILQQWKAHLGTDYGAPKGTPVRSVGDGFVSFAGWQNGYGNVVMIDHGNARQTVYAHLSRVDVRHGQRVDQAQTIGAVGATGWATGPHLHFEFRVDGHQQSPQAMARAAEAVAVTPALKTAFASRAATARAQLDALHGVVDLDRVE